MTDGVWQMAFAGDDSDDWEIGHVTSAPGVVPEVLAVLDANYRCFMAVPHPTAPILREITQKNIAGTRFLAWLTPAETLALGPGRHQVAFQISNALLPRPLVREVHAGIEIKRGLVTAP